MRRDFEDKKWQEVKKKVFERDKTCRLCKVLLPQELILLKRVAGSYINALDPAHYLPVSSHPELCYKSYNICALNRFSHSMLDSYKDPITGVPISKEEVNKWWIRILKGDPAQYNYLKDKGLIEE